MILYYKFHTTPHDILVLDSSIKIPFKLQTFKMDSRYKNLNPKCNPFVWQLAGFWMLIKVEKYKTLLLSYLFSSLKIDWNVWEAFARSTVLLEEEQELVCQNITDLYTLWTSYFVL